MRKTNNVIEFNGQRYDALTGELLASGSRSRTPADAPQPKRQYTTRRHPHHHSSHPPAASRTLMRQAVKKPSASKRRFRAQGHTDTLIQAPLSSVAFKQSVLQLDEKRLQHAKRITKSKFISRFSQATEAPASRDRLAQNLPVRPAQRVHQAQGKPAAGQHNPAKATEALLEHALEQATSYRELPATKRHRFRRRHHAGAGL